MEIALKSYKGEEQRTLGTNAPKDNFQLKRNLSLWNTSSAS